VLDYKITYQVFALATRGRHHRDASISVPPRSTRRAFNSYLRSSHDAVAFGQCMSGARSKREPCRRLLFDPSPELRHGSIGPGPRVGPQEKETLDTDRCVGCFRPIRSVYERGAFDGTCDPAPAPLERESAQIPDACCVICNGERILPLFGGLDAPGEATGIGPSNALREQGGALPPGAGLSVRGKARPRAAGKVCKSVEMIAATQRSAGLVVAVGSRFVFVPLAHVIEMMRPLPVEAVPGMPSFVMGLSVIRGAPVPVVDLATAMGVTERAATSRFVLLRLGDRRVALLVDTILGVRELDTASMGEMPPLFRGASEIIEAMGTLDARLLVVLRATRILSEGAWQGIEAREAS
jgi:purine-binding chemotaxis protein CheW